MIHSDVQVFRTCSIELYTLEGKLPDNEVILKGMARAQLPDGDWTFAKLVWDSERTVVLWYEEEGE